MRYTYVSDSCVEVSGYTKMDFLQMSLQDLIGAESAIKFVKVVNEAVEKYKKGETKSVDIVFEVQRPNKNGAMN
jgi:hypothetical protein